MFIRFMFSFVLYDGALTTCSPYLASSFSFFCFRLCFIFLHWIFLSLLEMGTLCNACGINYRRALSKAPEGQLDLDSLAVEMGHTRLSIQKALKRQRKQAATMQQFKRSRSASRSSPRSPPIVPGAPGPSSPLSMLLCDPGGPDTSRGDWMQSVPRNAVSSASAAAASSSAHPSYAPPGSAHSNSHHALQPSRGRRSGQAQSQSQSRLPPFEAFLGDLQKRDSFQ